MIVKSISFSQKNLFLELEKNEADERELITPENLHTLKIEYKISQIFESGSSSSITEFEILNKKEIQFSNNHLSFKVVLDDLDSPDKCEINIYSAQIRLQNGKNLRISIDKAYSFLQIKNATPIANYKNLHNHGYESANNIISQKISSNFGFFSINGNPEEVFTKFENETEIDDQLLKATDMEYSIREKLLKCLFLSIVNLTSLNALDNEKVKSISAQLIKKYYGGLVDKRSSND